MTTQNTSPEPQDAEPGNSSHVRAREPSDLPAVGAPTEPPLLATKYAQEFAATWDGTVGCIDVILVIQIAVAACRIAAILAPLFLGPSPTGKAWFARQIQRASRRHFPQRSTVFHESFAEELAEYIYGLPDNGVSEREVHAMLTELQANANSRNTATA